MAGSTIIIIYGGSRYLLVLVIIAFLACHIVCAEVPPALRLFALIFYPLIVVFLILLLSVLMVMYCVFRNYYHHGIYDDLEKSLLGTSKYYLIGVKGILGNVMTKIDFS